MTETNGATPPSSRNHNHVPLKYQVVIAERLRALLSKADADSWKYPPDYSDTVVAAEMAFKCTAHNVSGVRLELFGKLRPTNSLKIAPLDELRERVTRLETIVAGLIEGLPKDLFGDKA